MVYFITPSYSLGSLENRVELDNHVTGRVTRDFKNTQVWELTFSDPTKILGPKRDLRVSTGEKKEVVEPDNPNTANMQYRNVLFYKGELLDYNDNLADGSGDYTTRSRGDRRLHFWRVPTPDGAVYVAATHYPSAGGGILEVSTEERHPSYEAFQQDVEDTPSACRETGLFTSYTSSSGDRIVYDHGKATVNGKPWPLEGYELYESPYLNSKLASGVIRIGNGRLGTLTLDFRDRENPIRREEDAED
jgi:hypothetical protein